MTKLQLSSFATAVVLAVGVGTAAHAAERATPREARTMFEQAVRYMEENGAERAFAAFNDRQGNFVRKDLYVFAIDDKGVYQASGAAPEALVGLKVLDTTDAAVLRALPLSRLDALPRRAPKWMADGRCLVPPQTGG